MLKLLTTVAIGLSVGDLAWPDDLPGGEPAAAAIEPAPKVDSYDFATWLFDHGDYHDAVVQCTKAIEESPSDPWVYLLRAQCHEQLRDWDGALANYTTVAKLVPSRAEHILPRVLANRGCQRFQQGNLDAAIQDCERAMAVDERYAPAYLGRGLARQYQRRWDEAEADYSRYIDLYDGRPSSSVYYARGMCRIALRDWDGALADYTRVIDLKPTYDRGYLQRGIVLFELGEYKGALADLETALQLDPKSREAAEWRWRCEEALRGEDSL